MDLLLYTGYRDLLHFSSSMDDEEFWIFNCCHRALQNDLSSIFFTNESHEVHRSFILQLQTGGITSGNALTKSNITMQGLSIWWIFYPTQDTEICCLFHHRWTTKNSGAWLCKSCTKNYSLSVVNLSLFCFVYFCTFFILCLYFVNNIHFLVYFMS